MKLFLLFLLVATVVAMFRQRSGPKFRLDNDNSNEGPSKMIGTPIKLDSSDFADISWALAPRFNVDSGKSFYWVPIEVLTVDKKVVRMDSLNLTISVGESICENDRTLNDINPTRCPLKENGKRAVFGVEIKTEKKSEQLNLGDSEENGVIMD